MEPAGAVAALHRRASEWHAAHGAPADAIRHALEAGDVERAADLAEVAIPAWRRAREEVTIRHWLQLLPRDELRRRPVLMIGLIGARASIGEFPADTDELLDEAEVLMGRTSVVGDPAQLPAVPAAIVEEAASPDTVELRSLPEAMRDYPHVTVDAATAALVGNGRVLDREPNGFVGDGPWAVLGPDGELLAMYEAREGRVKPAVVVPGPAAT